MAPPDLGPLDRLRERSETLAGAWAARARGSTTVGRERALLRLFGVGGLDAAGRPLAWAAVDRYFAGGRDRLGGGVLLPFAMGLVEYDLAAQRLALDVASGAVDLGLEAELLREPDRRAAAEQEARRLAGLAFDQVDANRTARRELLGVLGDRGRPWVGTTISDPEIDLALDEARRALDSGADILRVEMPIGRELSDRLRDAGVEPPVWQPDPGRTVPLEAERAPTGSQRALASLRRHLDELAAQRRAYVRIATSPPALGGPESAVVAAFERVDVAESDPMVEIVAGRVAPERALADHAFAHALLARAGVVVAISAGPLVVAPDLARGMPSDPATRAGRALALQLLSVAVARGNGVPPEQLLVGSLPPWLGGESEPAARALAEVALRRLLMPDLGLAFEEPPGDARPASDAWEAIVAAVAPGGPATSLILLAPAADATRRIGRARVGAAVSAQLAAARDPAALAGVALDHARATAAAALLTLERLADEGWRAVLGDPPDGADRVRLGADAVAERTEAFDPFEAGFLAVG